VFRVSTIMRSVRLSLMALRSFFLKCPNISQMASQSVEIVPPYRRQENGTPSAAIRWPDFGHPRPNEWSLLAEAVLSNSGVGWQA